MLKQIVRWQVFETAGQLQDAAAAMITHHANHAIAERSAFLIVLAGGTTPREVYQRLAHAATDWSKWHVYFGDERCLPPEHIERNSRMAEEAWLSRVPIPHGQVHPIPAELGPEGGAATYSTLLATVGSFDLVLLGLGEDGHTASLFPGLPWQNATAPAIPVHGAPKPPPERVSLSAARLADARRVVYLVTGAGKQDAVREWSGAGNLPAAAVTPVSGVDVWLDRSAAGHAL